MGIAIASKVDTTSIFLYFYKFSLKHELNYLSYRKHNFQTFKHIRKLTCIATISQYLKQTVYFFGMRKRKLRIETEKSQKVIAVPHSPLFKINQLITCCLSPSLQGCSWQILLPRHPRCACVMMVHFWIYLSHSSFSSSHLSLLSLLYEVR